MSETREYEKYEFCSNIRCGFFHHIEIKCLNKHRCIFSAKDFHHWLKDNGFKIVKDK